MRKKYPPPFDEVAVRYSSGLKVPFIPMWNDLRKLLPPSPQLGFVHFISFAMKEQNMPAVKKQWVKPEVRRLSSEEVAMLPRSVKDRLLGKRTVGKPQAA
jgi:hypothetical protein